MNQIVHHIYLHLYSYIVLFFLVVCNHLNEIDHPDEPYRTN
jgi:hypothetical protein